MLRETEEESGVSVDPATVRFVVSQPWPFPYSLMVGYRGQCAGDGLPSIAFDKKEMDDVRWFSKEAVRAALGLKGSTALAGWTPDAQEAQVRCMLYGSTWPASGTVTAWNTTSRPTPFQLHFPGKSSLARTMLSMWVDEP